MMDKMGERMIIKIVSSWSSLEVKFIIQGFEVAMLA